ncbi:methyltransferase domain-containing protein [Nocardia sp. CDC153]|uniref:methyltransferase domain-containing protein n=1 Tax=Nocardia sp. CDC153 TaxID=3112167 RepID=UPI002DB9E92F|nr:methyltransferase domain-containing protein [Nocardia sp. CDC153]MEC3953199.1 methyltransferase domain-containing protein [Nocardia sp. CDC153]
MGGNSYSESALSHEMPTELGRLRLLEEFLEPFTTAAIERTGIETDWRCLDLGAGAGGVARWLSKRCPDGQVVAADIDVKFLNPEGNLEIREFDARTGDFEPGSFNLIHTRAMLMHLPERVELVARCHSWLAPGGWLVATDPSGFTSASSPYPEWRRLMDAFWDLMAAHGGDPLWGRQRLARVVAEAGFTDVDMAIHTAVVGTDGPADRFWRMFFAQVGPRMVELGLLTAGELGAGVALLDEPAFFDSPDAFVTVWGRRPG